MDKNELMRDAQETAPADVDKLGLIGTLVNKQVDLEQRIEVLESNLKKAKEELEVLATRTIPDAMLDAGVTRFDTEQATVKIEKQYFPGVKKEDEPAFYQWMLDNDKAGIVSSTVTVDLGKGGLERAESVLEAIRKVVNDPVSAKNSIHWQTLRAFARELSESGESIPEMLTIHQVDRAKIKLKD
jgi:hypothetical protein